MQILAKPYLNVKIILNNSIYVIYLFQNLILLGIRITQIRNGDWFLIKLCTCRESRLTVLSEKVGYLQLDRKHPDTILSSFSNHKLPAYLYQRCQNIDVKVKNVNKMALGVQEITPVEED